MIYSKRLVSLLVLCFAAIFCTQQSGFAASSPRVVVRDDLQPYFSRYATGTFVLYDEAQRWYTIYNEAQSEKRLSPCSTFKIFSALTGLETGVLDREDDKTLRKWDGTVRFLDAWNQDQTLASAMRHSVVWYFQRFIADIGAARMQTYLDAIDYGNRDISGGLTQFWLQSSLRISAREQVDVLRRLYAGDLPVAVENVAVVKKNLTLSDEDGVRFLGKTGSDGVRLGWFVGSVERDDNRYFFAVNLEGDGNATGTAARGVAEGILREMGLLV